MGQHSERGRHARPRRPWLLPVTVWQPMPGGWVRPVVIRPRIDVLAWLRLAAVLAVLLPLHIGAAALAWYALLVAHEVGTT